MRLSISGHRATIAAVGFVAGIAAMAVYSMSEPSLWASNNSAPTAVTAPVVAPAATTSYADAVSHAAPAVVTVRIEKRAEARQTMSPMDNDLLQRFFGQGGDQSDDQGGRRGGGRNQFPDRRNQQPLEEGLGSGVIVSSDGNILTNNHVVDGADRVTVVLNDGREFTGKVLGTDAPADLAVVHIDAKGLPTLPLADSDRTRVGDVVLAVGNPLGIGQTVTMGIISAKSRSTALGDGSEYEDFIQTDAPINEGNSGGALITAAGDLIGINSQIMSTTGGSIGIGFAIPSNMAQNVMTQLVATGHVRRGMLGVTVQALSSDLAKSLDLTVVRGALVDNVTPDSPAAKAGIQQGDVILKVNGREVNDSNDLRNDVSAMAPGSRVTIDLTRNGHSQQLSATLSEMPATPPTATEAPTAHDDLGMSLQPMTPALADRLQMPSATQGLAVTNVDPSGVAAHAGIRAGDVIKKVDGQPVASATALRDAITRHADRPALVAVQRGDATLFVAIGGKS